MFRVLLLVFRLTDGLLVCVFRKAFISFNKFTILSSWAIPFRDLKVCAKPKICFWKLKNRLTATRICKPAVLSKDVPSGVGGYLVQVKVLKVQILILIVNSCLMRLLDLNLLSPGLWLITRSIILCNNSKVEVILWNSKNFLKLENADVEKVVWKETHRGNDPFCGDGGLFSVSVELIACYHRKADRTDLLISKTWKLLHSPSSTNSEFKKVALKKKFCCILRIFFSLPSRNVIKTGEVDRGGKNWVMLVSPFLVALPPFPGKQSLFCFLPACEVSAAPRVGALLCALSKCSRCPEAKELDASGEESISASVGQQGCLNRSFTYALCKESTRHRWYPHNRREHNQKYSASWDSFCCAFRADLCLTVQVVLPCLLPSCFSLSVE